LINAFDAIKETLQITNVLTFYGVDIRHANKTLCPLHNEKTPSFTIYPNNNSWHCFGCGVGGSVIDFVIAYYGLDALEAAKKLDADFNLGYFDYKPTQEEKNQQSALRNEKQAHRELAETFEAYMSKAYIILCDYLHLLKDWKTAYAPKMPAELDTASPLFVDACHQLDYIEYLLDGLTVADYDEQIHFYQTHRKELVEIASKIKQYAESPKANTSD